MGCTLQLGLGQYVKMDYSLDVLCTFSLPFKNGHVHVPCDIALHKSKIGQNTICSSGANSDAAKGIYIYKGPVSRQPRVMGRGVSVRGRAQPRTVAVGHTRLSRGPFAGHIRADTDRGRGGRFVSRQPA